MKVDFDIIEKLDESIKTGATGCPNCLAKKFDISERLLYEYLREMKRKLGAPIDYCHRRKTYYYTEEYELYVGNLSTIKAKLVKDILATINTAMKFIIFLGIVWF